MSEAIRKYVEQEHIAKMSLGEIDRMLVTTDKTATEVFEALRSHFLRNPNKTRARKWSRFFRRNATLFGMVTDSDIAKLNEVRDF